jgi:hypothetical protein
MEAMAEFDIMTETMKVEMEDLVVVVVGAQTTWERAVAVVTLAVLVLVVVVPTIQEGVEAPIMQESNRKT